MQSQLESLQVKVVLPEGASGANGKPKPVEAAALKKKLEDECNGASGDNGALTSPIAFPMLPIDRYGFLITDKCVALDMGEALILCN